jgi:hypothetical protein
MARGHVAPIPSIVGQPRSCADAGIDGLTTRGISSSRETSISPYWASVSVRGMGVAVIARQCGVRRAFCVSSRRCTPKRCCSSITTSARLR